MLCLDLWGRNSGPFMQALHFSFGLGAFIAPLLAAPFLEPTTTDILPTLMASTAIPFQVSDLNGIGMERGKRQTSQNESIMGLSNNMEPFNNSALEFTANSLENVFTRSNRVITEIPVSTISNPQSIEFTATNGLDTNETTIQPIATTQRVPKRKPSKTNASSLGNKDWDRIHVGTLPKEDLAPISSTTTVSLSTITSITTRTMFPFVSPTSGSYSKLQEPLMLQVNETTVLAKEPNINLNPNPTYKTTDVTEPYVSTNGGKNTDFSKSKVVFPGSNTVNSTATSSTQNVIKNIDSEQTKNTLITNNNTNFIDVNGRTSAVAVDSIILSSSTEVIVPKISLASYMPSYSQGKVTVSYEESLNTHAYTTSKIPEELVPTVGTTVIGSHVKPGTGVSDQGSQSVTEYTSNIWNEEHTVISSKEQSTFLSTDPAGNSLPKHIHRSKPVTYDNDTEVINSLFDIVANRIERYGFNKVQFTYLMVGLFVFAISLVFLGFLCHNPRDPKSKQEEGQGTKKISNRAVHGLLISLMAVFFLLYVGLEVTYGQLVLAFAVHGDLQLAQSTGFVIAIVFWGSFAAMRFASIFFSSGFGPITMLLLNFVFCTLGTVLLSTMASHTETALWVGTALLGIGLASVFPTGILWIERYIHVSNKVAAAFVMGASLGEVVCPVAVYQLMVNNPAMLMHSAVVINILCIATFIALQWLALRHGEKYCAATNNGYQLANQEEEEDMIDMSPSSSAVAVRRNSFSSEHRALLNGNLHQGP